jgi:U3 small nucleolar RNA-associated protein 21
MQLWNIHTKTLIHTFASENLVDGASSAITCLVQSPAIDIVAIGFASGEITIHDIKTDERLMRIFQEGGVVKSLSFRTGKNQYFTLDFWPF